MPAPIGAYKLRSVERKTGIVAENNLIKPDRSEMPISSIGRSGSGTVVSNEILQLLSKKIKALLSLLIVFIHMLKSSNMLSYIYLCTVRDKNLT